MKSESRGSYHQPVLLGEAVRLLQPRPGALFLDGTLGGGGHSEAFAEAGAQVIGLDQDLDALAYAGERLERFGNQVRLVHANFRDAGDVLDQLGIHKVNGALLDLGVSSWQLNEPERGFSFQHDGPLDMRMNASQGETAEDLVNNLEEVELTRIFREFGEETNARRIAKEIVRTRARKRITRTSELAATVEKVCPRRGAKRHPATKVFQALRIAVNAELQVLQEGLEVIIERLEGGGRFGVITFHSLEDRVVKHRFKAGATEWLDRPDWPAPRRNPGHQLTLVTPKAVEPTEEETRANSRSRSAKLRVVEKLTYVTEQKKDR